MTSADYPGGSSYIEEGTELISGLPQAVKEYVSLQSLIHLYRINSGPGGYAAIQRYLGIDADRGLRQEDWNRLLMHMNRGGRTEKQPMAHAEALR